MRRRNIIAAAALLSATCYSAQENVVGCWTCTETNHVEHNDRSYDYTTTTRFVFTTSGTVTVSKRTPEDIQKPKLLNTTHSGSYVIEGSSLKVKAQEVSGYVMRVRGLDDSYSFALSANTLILTNSVTGKVRHLTKCMDERSPNQPSEGTR